MHSAKFLRHIVDLGVVAKGVRVEAHDFGPEKQSGLRGKAPGFERDFPVAFPVSAAEHKRLAEAGLDANYNDFCRKLPMLRSYAQPYWAEDTEAE